LLLCIVPSIGVSQSAAGPGSGVISQQALDVLVHEHLLFSGSAIVAQGSKVVASAHVGYAALQPRRRNSDRTLYSVASVGKMFTAVAIAQLVEADRVSYESAVVDMLPELRARVSEAVTIDHLLHHTSGIGRISDVDDATLDALESNADYYSLILANGIGSDGPAEFSYANENYQILGEIIERLSGQPYEAYIRVNIVRPAGMVGPVFIRQDRANREEIASNYMAVDFDTWWRSEEPIQASSPEEFVHVAPAATPSAGGGSYVTALDMIRFAAALREGKLISRRSFEAMCALSPVDRERGRGYGRGCSISRDSNGFRFGHTGSTAGIQARFFMYWNRDVDVIVLSNRDEQAAPLFRDIDRLIRAE
jgi:CubicO group peptidase (beta-lactamase class C family)